MALTDLSLAGLQGAVADWLGRSDLTTAQINDCVKMFESEFNRRMRIQPMETSVTFNTTSGEYTLPTDFLAFRDLTWEGSATGQLEYAHPMTMRGWYYTSEQGIPRWFTIEGSTLSTRPIDDSTDLTLRYWQKIPTLTASQGTTNWLMTDHPDIYLHGTLFHVLAFLHDTSNAALAKQLMDERLDQLVQASEGTKAPMAMQTWGWVA